VADEQNQNSNTDEVSETDALKAQVEKFKNDYLYLRAEFENYKRNAIKERSELIKYGNERLLVDLLGVLDNFDRALEVKATADNLSTYVKGVEMTAQEFRQALQKNGVTEVPSQGQVFDPAMHEALSSEETDSVKPGHISRVFKKAYKLHDRVIRPGQVVVAKTPTTN
jgi:molecular chaperone GrpE